MDNRKKSYQQIEPINEEELEQDLRFLFHNRSDTADQFVDGAIPVIKHHVNQVMARYQDRLLLELTQYFKGEMAGIMLRHRREPIFHSGSPIGRGSEDIKTNSGGQHESEDETTAW